jgi:diaminopimelate decarboxylase
LNRTNGASSPLFAYEAGRLQMDGVAIAACIERQATPFFLVSERRLIDNYRALSRGLASAGGEIAVRYCAKTNHEAGILAVLAREGCGLLASHLAEVELGLAAGFAPEAIAFQRPTPSPAEVEAVLAAGVRYLHVFRPADIGLYAALAERHGVALRLSLRLRAEPGLLRHWAVPSLANLNARLGLSLAEARAVAVDCRDRARLRISALNVYVGTQQLGAGGFDRALGSACRLAREMGAQGLATIEEVNLGGGLPSPSLRRLRPGNLWARWRDRPRVGDLAGGKAGDPPQRLAGFAGEVAARFHGVAARAGLGSDPILGAEPGRAIVGNAAVLVTSVVAAEGRWLFLDASRSYLGESPLLFGRALLPERRTDGRPVRFRHLSGSTLNTLDVLDLFRRLPSHEPGESLLFCDAGAYSISRATRYAGLAPPVLMLDLAGELRTLRRAESVGDLAGPMAPGLSGAGCAAPVPRI